jgi:hypothetical protein
MIHPIGDLQIPSKVLVEVHADDPDARDVIVEMEGGTIYTTLFVTLSYLRRQLDLTLELCKQVPDSIPVRFAALDTPHIVVDKLDRDIIEDTIDNLMAMEVFESVFIQVTETETTTTTTNGNGRRATQEVAAVVLSDVLVVEGN